MKPTTLTELLQYAAKTYGDLPALRQPEGTQVHTWSWNQYLAAAEEIAAGLRSLGVQKGEHVAICSETRAEFYLADLGIMCNGAVSGALYPSYTPAELMKTMSRADAKVLFVEDPAMYAKLKDSPVEHVILMTGEVEDALTLAKLRKHGRYMEAVHEDDNAILYLTSGATGDPKMVMVTHGSVARNLHMAYPNVIDLSPEDITIAFLPSAHIAQRLVVELLPILTGTPVSFAESLMKLPNEIKQVRPTVFLAPPRMWERVYASIKAEVNKRPPLAQKAFAAALGLGLGAAKYKRQGKSVPAYIRIPLEFVSKVIFAKIKERFGGRLRIAISGAAPLGADLADFYDAVGMPLNEGFGLTEAGVLCFNPLGAPRSGSIGKVLPGVTLKIADDGELLVQSPSVSKGYYKDPEATAELFRDGWLHTGDVAHIDDDGYVYITGRKKELIVSSNGKKIFPARVEALFKFEPLISQIVLAGDNLPHLVALFTINPQLAATFDGPDAVQKEVQKIVSRINKQLAPFEQVKRYKILPRDFSMEKGELTATMKVRRKQVMENFAAELNELFKASASSRTSD